ncbi:hypothetical protein GCM10019016_062850 [Streptomyces prasinosporus]|uniref:Uncharacterized protein n=1 Tax=Streptomyces prasinosporus TaxID=68256 RepID=A0ABP6TYM7_9ACTN
MPPSPHATTVHAPGRPPPPYGYPQPGLAVPAHGPVAAAAHRTPRTPAPVPPAPVSPPHGAQPPQRPAPARIDQVRAELDELSDYLRRQDGQQRGDHEGGR